MSQLELANFKADFDNFGPGTLTWEVFDPTKSTPFLDLTITIKNGNITTSTYQKPLNLYQYIPPNSAHPLGMIKGMIYGMLQRFYKQNSNREDYWTIAMLFYNRLKNRGWTREIIEPIFIEAHSKIILSHIQSHLQQQKMIYHRNRSYYTGNMIQMVSAVKRYVNYTIRT